MTWLADENTALLNVDVTYDFLPPNGALRVTDGDKIIPILNGLREHFQKVVWTKEEHDKDHEFFASTRGKQVLDTVETDFGTQYLWPDHCVEGTNGAEFHVELDIKDEDMIVVKGRDSTIHAYSAFYMDDRKTIITYEDGKTLTEKLKDHGITKLVVTGLAYDFCAGMTAYDAAKEGFDVTFVRDASYSINIPIGDGRTTIDVMDEMLAEAGVKVVNANQVQQTLGVKHPTP